jgi:hypothetical protein
MPRLLNLLLWHRKVLPGTYFWPGSLPTTPESLAHRGPRVPQRSAGIGGTPAGDERIERRG